MYNTTAEYKEYIKKPSRDFECRVKIGNRTFTNTEVIEIVPETVQPSDGFSIGNTVSQSIDITLKNDGGVYAAVGIVDVEIGIKIGNTIEYIPVGTYNIDDVTKTDYTVKLTCYDKMIKFETGYFEKYENPTLQQVIEQLEETTGVEFDGSVPSYTLTKLSGYTCREILAYVASVCGGNAFITRDGRFTIKIPTQVDYRITPANYFNTGYTNEDSTYKIGMITCQNKTNTDYTEDEDYDSANEKNTISVGSLSSDTMELTFENPWVTEDILNDIYGKLKDFSYLGYTMKWQGDMSLDVGDIVTVVDKNNIERKAFIYANRLNYTGGLTAETSAKGETKNSNSFSASGNGISEINRIAVKLLIAEKAIINKANIKDLQATNAKIENLDANIAKINTALINYATIDMLNAVKANISDLVAKDAEISNALINKADITQLNAANANISKLDATVADIKTLVNGNLTSSNIHSLVLTSSKVTVQDGFIKNAMIDSLDVSKINAGTISTDKFTIASDDGGISIEGATQQFKDKNNKVRIQMGQDATGDFNFILRGEDGTTILIDSTGIKENAIADKLIKSDMVADNAIGEEQINYSSLISGINKDENTKLIKASKVAIDLNGQTLEVAFKNIRDEIDNINTSIDITTINIMQGKIETLISNTTIEKNGETIQLKDAYNSTVQTIDSLNTVIGDHKSYINPETGEAETVISSLTNIRTDLKGLKVSVSNVTTTLNGTTEKLTELESTLDGFKSRIETYDKNISDIQTDVNNTKTEINQKVDSVNQIVSNTTEKVTELETNINSTLVSMTQDLTGITSKITTLESNLDNFSIGTRNYILASDFSEDIYTKYWDIGEYYSIEEYEHNYYYFHHVLVCENNSRNQSDTSQCIDSINANTKYTLSCKAKGEATITFGEVIYNKETEKNDYIIHRIDVDSEDYKKYAVTFNTNENIRYGYVTITTPGKSNSKVTLLKLEEGNTASDWTPAPEETEGKISDIDTSVKETTTQISLLKDSIDLKVSSTEFKDTINTMNTEIQLQAGKIESKVEINEVGTIISQSPNDVMTAFNGISEYFKVSPEGAEFGNISSGAYTKISTSGLEYVSSEGAVPYHYVSYSASASVDMAGVTSKTVTINFPSNIVAMLNGKVPKATVNITSAFTMDHLYNWCSVSVDTITSTSITVRIYFSSGTIVASTSYNSFFYTTNISTQKGGMKYNNIAFNYLIIG